MVEKEMLQVYVVIPVRKLKNVKSRLSRFLVDELRWKFNLKMLSDVLVSVKNSRFVEKVFVVTPDMKVVTEEIFGPTMGVMRAKDLDEAIELSLIHI